MECPKVGLKKRKKKQTTCVLEAKLGLNPGSRLTHGKVIWAVWPKEKKFLVPKEKKFLVPEEKDKVSWK